MKRILGVIVLLFVVGSTAVASDYVIGDGDGLNISVWGAPELSVAVLVRPDGKITLPAAGDVAASGFTPAQLSKELTKKLADYVKTPIVTVTVAGITNNKVYISGGGVPARVINLTGRTTLFKLLCGIEGVENADLMRATLMRGSETVEVDFYELFGKGNLAADVELRPEDVIFLPNNDLNKIYVVGAVSKAQSIVYRDGLRILDVILESGGFTKFAKESAVLILRKSGDSRTRMKLNIKNLMTDGDLAQNISLERGDYVIVQESMF